MEFGWRLRESAEQGKYDKVLRELEAGTPVDCSSYSSGRSALHLASGGLLFQQQLLLWRSKIHKLRFDARRCSA